MILVAFGCVLALFSEFWRLITLSVVNFNVKKLFL